MERLVQKLERLKAELATTRYPQTDKMYNELDVQEKHQRDSITNKRASLMDQMRLVRAEIIAKEWKDKGFKVIEILADAESGTVYVCIDTVNVTVVDVGYIAKYDTVIDTITSEYFEIRTDLLAEGGEVYKSFNDDQEILVINHEANKFYRTKIYWTELHPTKQAFKKVGLSIQKFKGRRLERRLSMGYIEDNNLNMGVK